MYCSCGALQKETYLIRFIADRTILCFVLVLAKTKHNFWFCNDILTCQNKNFWFCQNQNKIVQVSFIVLFRNFCEALLAFESTFLQFV